jgi:membrane fusion protein (multidrug efflux system)
VEILDGLEPGDRVVTHGTLKIRTGQQVTISEVDDGSRPRRELLETGRDAGTAP